jgi:Tol biopolymer transport system component/predicted Ser/Thr protein kinase
MSLAPGTRLGPYEILADIGAGGMGEVYRAHDTRLGREVAIKIAKERFSERFDREARAVAALNHPNICHLYDVGPNYLVMELIEGPTLAGRISDGAIPLDEALPIARQIAEALEAAHDKGIVHRDLKPGNIKVKPDGSVKVLDFGLAKLMSEASPLTSDSPTTLADPTRMGVILGTAAYMAPEQARGKVVDKRADIWAFGVVLFEMLTGRRLFQGEDVTETLAAVVKDQPDLSTVPPRVQRLLRKCLEKDPRKRLRHVSGIELLLEEAEVPSPAASRGWWLWPAAGVLIAALAWVPWRGVKSAVPTELPLERLDVDLGKDVGFATAPGAGSRIAISPDGGRLVYMAARRLFSRPLDRTEAIELKGPEGGGAPFFSPDGQWVGFFAEGKLMKIPAAGGSPTVISDASPSGGSWGDNDVIVATFGGRTGLMTVPASGGTPRRITKLEAGEAVHVWPQMLPGGKAVLFTSNGSVNDGFNDAKIEAVTLKDGRRKVIQQGGTYGRYISAAKGPGHLIYVHEGTLFAVAFDPDKLQELGVPAAVAQNVSTGTGGAAQLDFARDGSLIYRFGGQLRQTRELSWVGPSGMPERLPLKPDDYRFVRLSPDGQKLALTVARSGGMDLLVYDWKRDVTTRLTFDGKVNDVFAWSPDGRFIVFAGNTGIFWTRADGGGKPQMLHPGNGAELAWSFAPDGKTISMSENGTFAAGPNSDIWTLPVESDAAGLRAGKPEVFLQTPFQEGRSAFSPDGRWLTYSSNEAGGSRHGVYVRGFPDTGGKWQVASDGDYPRWSPKGRYLFFLDGAGKAIFKVNYTAKGDTFAPDKPSIWIPAQNKQFLVFDIAADGQRAVVMESSVGVEQTSVPGHLTFLIHFADELARRAPATR